MRMVWGWAIFIFQIFLSIQFYHADGEDEEPQITRHAWASTAPTDRESWGNFLANYVHFAMGNRYLCKSSKSSIYTVLVSNILASQIDLSIHFAMLTGAEWEAQTLSKKATIHQVATMLATSKNVLFPSHNHMLATCADDRSHWLSPECHQSVRIISTGS